MSDLQYLPDDTKLIDAPLWFHLRGLSQTRSGYGARLATTHKVNYQNRLYRVYCTCYGNAGSLWIQTKQGKLYLR